MFALLAGLAQAACTPDALDRHLDRAQAAYLAGDLPGLRAGLRAVHRARACVDSPQRAARVHLVRGLLPALAHDWPAAREAFRASAAAHPLLPFPEPLWADQRLHLAWQRAQELPIAWRPTRPAWTDGALSTRRPDTRRIRVPARKVRGAEPTGDPEVPSSGPPPEAAPAPAEP